MILKNRLLFCLFTMRLSPELPKYYSYVYMDALLSRLEFQMQYVNLIINKDVDVKNTSIDKYSRKIVVLHIMYSSLHSIDV